MPSRRHVLRATPAVGTTLLAGCSIQFGDGSSYASWIPSPDGFAKFHIDRSGRFDAARIRDRTDRLHPECRDDPLGCTIRTNDVVYESGTFLAPKEVDRVVYGGTDAINSYPRSRASLLGVSTFKVFEYNVESATVQSRLADAHETTSHAGSFTLYGDGDGTVQAADDGTRLVLGLDTAIRAVVERVRGEGESFTDVESDRRLAREHLGDTVAEYVESAPGAGEDGPAWADECTILAGGATLGDASVTYRSVTMFEDEATLSALGDAAVREWVDEQFPPTVEPERAPVDEPRIERDGRALVVSGTTDRYAGLY